MPTPSPTCRCWRWSECQSQSTRTPGSQLSRGSAAGGSSAGRWRQATGGCPSRTRARPALARISLAVRLMLALEFSRSIPSYLLMRAAGGRAEVATSDLSLLHLGDVDVPELPGPGWRYVRPLVSGVCGSDLAALTGHASFYLEPLTSYPFIPGHELSGRLEDGTRVVVQPVLGCAVRGIEPPCRFCAEGRIGLCLNVTEGPIDGGLPGRGAGPGLPARPLRDRRAAARGDRARRTARGRRHHVRGDRQRRQPERCGTADPGGRQGGRCRDARRSQGRLGAHLAAGAGGDRRLRLWR